MARIDYGNPTVQDAIDNLIAAACGVSRILSDMAMACDDSQGEVQAQEAEANAYQLLSDMLYNAARPFYEAEEVAGDAE